MTPWVPIVGYIVDFFKTRSERKKAESTAKAKLEIAKNSTKQEIELTDAEWEAIAVSKQDSSWKDEYVTLIITWPFIGIMFGTLYHAWSDDPRIIDGTLEGLDALKEVGVEMNTLMIAVVFAAVGLKMWRGGRS